MNRNRIEAQNVRIEYKAGLEIPKLAKVRQSFVREPDLDAAAVTAAEVRKVMAGQDLSGKRIAVAVGSRGIPELDTIVRTVIRIFRQAGADPVIVPAMGSHGGATAEGQAKVLAAYGIT